MENYIELKIHNMSGTLYPAESVALVLKEVWGDRKIPIIIGKLEAHSIQLGMKGIIPPRPLPHDLVMDLVFNLNAGFHYVLIYKAKDGVFYSYIYMSNENGDDFKLDARTSDAIAIALRCKCPIYTTEEILQKEHLHDLGDGKFSVPITSVSLEMLEDALQKAIANEEYEQASHLRDEISKRKGESD